MLIELICDIYKLTCERESSLNVILSRTTQIDEQDYYYWSAYRTMGIFIANESLYNKH